MPYLYGKLQMCLLDVRRAEALTLDVPGDVLKPLLPFIQAERLQLVGKIQRWIPDKREISDTYETKLPRLVEQKTYDRIVKPLSLNVVVTSFFRRCNSAIVYLLLNDLMSRAAADTEVCFAV